MSEFVSQVPVPVPTNLQELDQAIQRYRSSDLSGSDLYRLWQAIRDLSLELEQVSFDLAGNRVAGEPSY
jgi:hypothetical protein